MANLISVIFLISHSMLGTEGLGLVQGVLRSHPGGKMQGVLDLD